MAWRVSKCHKCKGMMILKRVRKFCRKCRKKVVKDVRAGLVRADEFREACEVIQECITSGIRDEKSGE